MDLKGREFLSTERPVLTVVIDTEEEFDWSMPFKREGHTTEFHKHQACLQAIFDKNQIVPTYVVDYPVAACRGSVRLFQDLSRRGLAEIGVHCHPWVTPPFSERLDAFNSYHGNLPAELECAKILATREIVADQFGFAPKVFKAGRYGIGPRTFGILSELEFEADCSVVPVTSFRADGGPSFGDVPTQPCVIAQEKRLFEFPLTVGFIGSARQIGPRLANMYNSDFAHQVRLPGLLSRLALLRRVRLSPENASLEDAKRLVQLLVSRGDYYFSVSFHSSCIVPGCTEYVKNEEELEKFLNWLDSFFEFFLSDMNGRSSNIDRLAMEFGEMPAGSWLLAHQFKNSRSSVA